MDYLIIIIFSLIIITLFLILLIKESNKSNSIKLEGQRLTIWYLLKKEVINLESDIKKWNVTKRYNPWTGKLYYLNLKLKSGKWNRIYSKSRNGKIGQLIDYLEKSLSERQLKV